ncbi:AAA family ATPase [Rahnella inusitata]|uniref:AAA family ATPase n=1 Tax=Rahnella inusitata TaxID=58169 RepID=UPI0039BE1621
MNDNKEFNAVSRNAQRGDIQSLYQMHLNECSENKNEDDFISSYLQKIYNRANNDDFVLKDIIFNDFRGIRNLTLRLDERLTVIVGNNGIGKSSLLDGISITLSWFKSNVLREDRPAREIKDSDINNAVQSASITTKINFSDSIFSYMIANSRKGSVEKQNNDLLHIKSLSGIYRHSNEFDSSLNMPIVSYYGIHRASDELLNNKSRNKKQNKWSKLGAYEETGINRQGFDNFLEWFKFIFLSSRESSDNRYSRIEKLEYEIKTASSILDSMPEGFISVIESMKEEIKIKTNEIKELTTNLGLSNNSYASKLLEGIKAAFFSFLPNLEEISFNFSKEELIVEFIKNGNSIQPEQLSQGEKSLLSLVGDIAKRLVLLNPSLDNPLEGKGIVLIDEIDLHLHPGWQQIIIENLLKTFPNVQFIISTHSPQVLTTVPKKCIRILKERFNDISNKEELVAVQPKFQTKGVISADVLSVIMEIDPTPPVEEASWLEDYKELIELNELESKDANVLQLKLIEHFGKQHPLMLECENMILLQKIKSKIAKKKKEG